MSKIVFNICWTPKEVDSNACKEMDLLAKWGQSDNSMSLYRLPAKGMAQIEGVYSYPKI